MRTTRRHAGTILVVALALVAAGLGFAPADAAARPPRVSKVQVVERTFNALTIRFAVPAAYYHPGAGVVVRLTQGRKPAARPGKGVAVPANARHEASPTIALKQGTLYTFALWVRDNGRFSKRVVIRARTTTYHEPPGEIGTVGAQATVDPTPRVHLTWVASATDDLASIRIVRNTVPTTTGGTVFTLPGSARSWTDTKLPTAIDHPGATPRFSSAPLYYWLIAKDKAGYFSRLYTRKEVVVGSRTLSGHVAGTDRFVAVYCCPAGSTNQPTLVTTLGGLSAGVDGGAFSVAVPPGTYAVCEGANHPTGIDTTAACWVADSPTTGHTVPWGGTDEDVSTPSVDLRTATSYAGISFTGTTPPPCRVRVGAVRSC
jgi:hypothetical protein